RDALTIPVAALLGSQGTDKQIARVVTKNGAIKEREVQLGISDRLRVEVLDGLDEGDHLLIGPASGSGG
ncbi:UNVERIFIED_CONTAM: efflux RND transporter periplasmic adaptor subunit, partial [Salmonella enterica subsp. enterica serovar Weltevreden]